VAYSVRLTRAAEKGLRRLSPEVRRRVGARIDRLADDPRPAGARELSGCADDWRARVGAYRVCRIDDDARAVVVVEVGHRGDVYRRR